MDTHRISNRTPLLDRVPIPEDLRRLPEEDLRQLADELRAELIDAVNGGEQQFPGVVMLSTELFTEDCSLIQGAESVRERPDHVAVRFIDAPRQRMVI